MSQAYFDELKVVEPAYRYDTGNIDPNWTQIPEHCTQCGADMRVRRGWKPAGYDSETGEANRYNADIICSKLKRPWAYPFNNSYKHDEKLLIYTPAKFNFTNNEGKKFAHLTVLVRGY